MEHDIFPTWFCPPKRQAARSVPRASRRREPGIYFSASCSRKRRLGGRLPNDYGMTDLNLGRDERHNFHQADRVVGVTAFSDFAEFGAASFQRNGAIRITFDC